MSAVSSSETIRLASATTVRPNMYVRSVAAGMRSCIKLKQKGQCALQPSSSRKAVWLFRQHGVAVLLAVVFAANCCSSGRNPLRMQQFSQMCVSQVLICAKRSGWPSRLCCHWAQLAAGRCWTADNP